MDTIQATNFWNWFNRFKDVYNCLHRLPAVDAGFWMDELASNLKLCGKGQWQVDFKWSLDGGDTDMIFTAKRQLPYFDIIGQLVQQAPVIPGWKFHALYPPMQPGYNIVKRFGATCIEPDELWISPATIFEVEGGKYFVDIYAELYNPSDLTHRKIVDAILFNILGERSMVLELAGFKVSWLYGFNQECRSRLKPLKKLPAVIAALKAQDARGGTQLKSA